MVVGPGWSPWSQRYLQPGDLATSPGLRRFVQIQARLKSSGENAAALHRIAVAFHQPVAQHLRAEVWPTTAEAGVLDTFALYVQPNFLQQPADVRSPGFDQLLLHAEPSFDLKFVDAAMGTEAELLAGTPLQWDDELRVHAEGDSLWLEFPQIVQGASDDVLTPVYYRSILPGDEVPTGLDRNLLTFTSHGLLPDAERGAVRYFQRLADGSLAEVDAADYEALSADEQGPVRYFRKVVGLGDQVPFDAAGDSLDERSYDRLGSQRGWIVGRGRLLRVRFAGRVYLQGTRMQVAVRQSQPATPWQVADGGDATALSPSKSLSIGAQGAQATIDDIAIAPNPFTPNGDGINETAEIGFSLFRVQAARPLTIHLYTLAGRRVQELTGLATGGPQQFRWDGKDEAGQVVPPGLYLCQITVEADAEGVGGTTRTRLIAVAY